jgi:hypothetical protein
MWDFVVDKVALGQVFSEYFGFPCQSSFLQLLHNHPHLSSGAFTIGQKWPQYLVDLVPPHKKKISSVANRIIDSALKKDRLKMFKDENVK